jgi:DNA end-binding protein Ku
VWAPSWQPEQYHDEYRDALLATIQAKANGKSTRKASAEGKKPSVEVIDMIDLLRQSVAKEGKKAANEPGKVRRKA